MSSFASQYATDGEDSSLLESGKATYASDESFLDDGAGAVGGDSQHIGAPYTVSSLLKDLKQSPSASAGLSTVPAPLQKNIDYLFKDESKIRGERGWNEKICNNTGLMYGSGLLVGGMWGAVEGLRAPHGSSFKLRVNTVLNGCTRRGPLLGNSAGVATMFYTTFAHGISVARGHKEDMWNDVGAAALAGAVFKSTAGLPTALKTSALFSGVALLLSGAHAFYKESKS